MKEQTLDDGIHKVWIGQNAQDNWDIIKQANKHDIWFHVENYSSSHVILRLEDKKEKPTKQLLMECASICKEHSKYKNHPDIKICYTTIDNVSKGETVGSVYTKRTQTLKV